MTIPAEHTELLLLVARQAYATAANLPPLVRADLLEGISLIVPHEESEGAKLAAFSLRQCERHQMLFSELLAKTLGTKEGK